MLIIQNISNAVLVWNACNLFLLILLIRQFSLPNEEYKLTAFSPAFLKEKKKNGYIPSTQIDAINNFQDYSTLP